MPHAVGGPPPVAAPSTFEGALDAEWAASRALMIGKQAAYGSKGIEAFGELGVLVRASDKLERLKHLIHTGADPDWETVEDTWRDLMNYALIALMVRHGTWGLPMEGVSAPVAESAEEDGEAGEDDPDALLTRVVHEVTDRWAGKPVGDAALAMMVGELTYAGKQLTLTWKDSEGHWEVHIATDGQLEVDYITSSGTRIWLSDASVAPNDPTDIRQLVEEWEALRDAKPRLVVGDSDDSGAVKR